MQADIYCAFCKWYIDGAKCKAFPDEIPDDIWIGYVDHDKPYPGDNGMRFEPANPEFAKMVEELKAM